MKLNLRSFRFPCKKRRGASSLPSSAAQMSTFGTHFRVTTFGESHCKGVGCIVDGVPPQLPLTEADIQPQLTRRRPGQSRCVTLQRAVFKWPLPIGLLRGILATFACLLAHPPLNYLAPLPSTCGSPLLFGLHALFCISCLFHRQA